ncbi:MAG TPA: hypothetical protein VFB14_18640 [Bryobacteraceae bacterium]|nr:hypothetical protein [Bryobacteraceae bacterium]
MSISIRPIDLIAITSTDSFWRGIRANMIMPLSSLLPVSYRTATAALY